MYTEEITRLITDINEVCKKLDRKWDINSGGCCLVSAAIAEGLERFNIKYKVVLYYSRYRGPYGALEVRKNIKTKDIDSFPNGDETGSHYTIYIPSVNTILNSSYFKDDYYYRKTMVSKITCKDLQWIYNTGCWNDCYDTKHNISVRKKINSIFNKYEKEFNERKFRDEML